MSEDILKKIQYLIDKEIGDTGRPYHIKDSLERAKTLYLSDQKYLQTMISKHVSSFTSKTISKESSKPYKQIESDTHHRQNLEKKKSPVAVNSTRQKPEYGIRSKLDKMDKTIKKHESKNHCTESEWP